MDQILIEFTNYLNTKKYSDNSIHSHRLDIKGYNIWLNEQGINTLPAIKKIDAANLTAYSAFLLSVKKPRTVARHISSLKLYFAYLEQMGILSPNPMELVKFPKIDYTPPEFLTIDTVVALLETPDLGHFLGLRDRAMLELTYSSGLKVNELMALNTSDLFLDLQFLKVKGKRERMVPITVKAIEILRLYLDKRPKMLTNPEDSCLFPSKNGKRMSRVGYWNMIKKHATLIKSANKITPRALRHSFAVHLIEKGMDLSGIQMLFGYVNLNAAAQYAHINPPDFFEVYHNCHPRAKVVKAKS